MSPHLAAWLVLSIVLAGCAQQAANEQVGISSNAGLGTDVNSGESDYEFGRVRGSAVPLDGTRPDGGVFYVDGQTVHVNFPGGQVGNIETNSCAAQYDMVADERSGEVNITVYNVRPASPPAESVCDAAQWFVTLSVELVEPLGDRTLSTGSSIVNPAFIDQRLEPTRVPEGWGGSEDYWNPVRAGRFTYGQVTVEIQARADKPGADIVRGNAKHVNVDIVHVGDGAVVTRSNGVHRLGFDNAGWFYDFIAQPALDRDELIEFARSFALPDGVSNGVGEE